MSKYTDGFFRMADVKIEMMDYVAVYTEPHLLNSYVYTVFGCESGLQWI